jgi:hypothetical protein
MDKMAKPEEVKIVSKPQATLNDLIADWRERGVKNLSTITVTQDGKNTNVQLAEGWPLIVIGPGGGINLQQSSRIRTH